MHTYISNETNRSGKDPVDIYVSFKTILVSGLTNTRSIYPIPLPSAWMLPTHPVSGLRRIGVGCGASAQRTAHIPPPVRALFFSKFAISGHLTPSVHNLSIFLFTCLIWSKNGIFGRASPFRLFGQFLRLRMPAPKEHPGSRPVIIRATPALRGIYLYALSKRAIPNDGCKNLGWHIKTIFGIPFPVNSPLSISVR